MPIADGTMLTSVMRDKINLISAESGDLQFKLNPPVKGSDVPHSRGYFVGAYRLAKYQSQLLAQRLFLRRQTRQPISAPEVP